ncbi:ATP-grasp domain-containing protein [Paenibacillus sp. FSL H8-0104]|uniref:ATP-grasp domain-containing protein n=1 Tax=Paenibacillus sp. FSL H8-0104 TaxID=2954509 RepID=UPI0030FDAA33
MKEIENLIKDLKPKVESLRANFNVSLLTNTRSKTREINNSLMSYSTNNEFFNQEFEEVLTGIQNAGFFVEPFFNEIEFILTTLKESSYRNKRFVYNLSRNGQHTGKKSLIPSFCDLMSIPYTGSDALVISFSRAKYMYTKYLDNHGIKVPNSWVYDPVHTWLNGAQPLVETNIIIKPMHESASIGLSKSSIKKYNQESQLEITRESLEKNTPLLVQEFISGFECEVPLLISSKPYAMNPVGISIDGENHVGQEILTYAHSYSDSYGFYSLDKEFPKSVVEKIRSTATQIGRLVGLKGYGRVDFRINNQGVPYLMDIAASPYTTQHSSFAFAYEQLGLNYHDIYSSIIALSANSN